MDVIFDMILVSGTMMIAFFLVFLFMYLLALMLFPIEKSISKFIWDNTAPPPMPAKPKSSFKDFSKKH